MHATPLRKSHSIEYVLDLCVPIDADFDRLRDAARVLTPYASDFRYPGRRPEPSDQEMREALDLARDVMRFVLERMPAEVPRPRGET